MEEYVRQSMALQPMPGYERAYLPGGREWEREREWAQTGSPVSPRHRQCLENVARDDDDASAHA